MDAPLPVPSPSDAARMLAVVPWADRLRAGRMKPPIGLIRNDVRSLQELELLLEPAPSTLPGLDFASAAAWVERAVGDAGLAAAIREEAAREASYVDRCRSLHAVVARRVAQVREAAGAAGKEA
ncbi:MAG: hypothetical protein KJ062_00995 [Thermoanaerobaculia bacterium]|nr:hypothetical protein [Thermoanaerobaculia bacterium]